MSLKAFHILFIIISILICIGFWAWVDYVATDVDSTLNLMGKGSLIAGLGLIGYFVYFLRKTRNLIVG